MIEHYGRLVFQVGHVEHKLNDQRKDQQDVDVFEITERDVARELKKLLLCLLISDAKCNRIDWFIPSLLEEEDNFLMASAGAVAEILIIRVIVDMTVPPTVFTDIHVYTNLA